MVPIRGVATCFHIHGHPQKYELKVSLEYAIALYLRQAPPKLFKSMLDGTHTINLKNH